MPATVTGAFVILDRASAPMRRMREEAEKLDMAMRSTGDRMDDIGTSKQLQQYDDTSRKLRDVDRAANELGGANGGLANVEKRSNSSSRGLNVFTGRLQFMILAVTAALPLLVDLGGALGALVGSLGRATVGLGAFVVGAGGAAAVGLAGLASIIVPTIGKMSQLNVAYKALTKAQAEYGASSQQAATAAKNLNGIQRQMRQQGLATGPAMNLLEAVDKFKAKWMESIKPGQRDFFGLLNDGMDRARHLMPAFADSANRSMAAARGAVDTFLKRLDGPEFRKFLDDMTGVVEKTAGPLADSLANVGEVLSRIARAVVPELEKMAHAAELTTDSWVRGTQNMPQLRTEVHQLTGEFGDWVDLLKASWDFVKQLFGSGADQGQGLVEDMTKKLQEGTAWMQKNPDQMNQFWKQAIQGTKQLARLLGDLVPVLMDVADAMRPISNAIEDIVHFISELNIGKLNMLTILLGGIATNRLFGKVGGALATTPLGAVARGTSTAGAASPVLVGGMASPALRTAAGAPVGGYARATVAGMRASGAGLPSSLAAGFAASREAGMLSSGGALAGGLGRMGMGALRMGGRFLAPLSAIMAVSDFLGTEGNIGDKLQGALSGATLGIIPGPVSEADQRRAGRQRAAKVAGAGGPVRTAADARGNIMQLRQARDLILQGATAFGGGGGGGSFNGRSTVAIQGPGDQDLSVEDRATANKYNRIIDKLHDVQHELKRTADVEKAMHFGQDLADAFDVRTGKLGQDPVTAFGGVTDDLLKEMDSLGFRGRNRLAQTYETWGREMVKNNPELQKSFADTTSALEGKMQHLGKNIEIINGQILTGTDAQWQKIRLAIKNPAEQAVEEAHTAFTKLQQEAVGQLTAMGYSASEAHNIIAGQDPGATSEQHRASRNAVAQGPGSYEAGIAGGHTAGPAAPTGGRHAGGGRLGGAAPGRMLMDNVGLPGGDTGAAGELMVNRHTERDVDYLLGGRTTLDRLVHGESRPHGNNFASGGRRGKTSAGTSVNAALNPASGALVPGHPELHTGISQAAEDVLKQFPGLTISSTTGGTHVSGSYHYLGEAVDLAGDSGTMLQASDWIKSSGLYRDLQEGIHNPNLSVSGGHMVPSSYYADVWAEHANHIHLAVTEAAIGALQGIAGGVGAAVASGGAIQQAVRLKGGQTALSGVPGAMSQRVQDAVRKGMESKVNSKIGATAGGVAGAVSHGNLSQQFPQLNHTYQEHMAPDYGGETLPFNVVAALAEAAGMPGVTMAQIAKGESGLRPGSAGTDPGGTQGFGLWAITTGVGNDAMIQQLGGPTAMLNPLINATAAARIFGSSGIGAWYGTRYLTDPNAHYSGGAAPGTSRAATGTRLADWGGWHGGGLDQTYTRPTLIGVGESGAEHVTVTPGGRSGRRHQVSIAAIHINNNRPGDIKDQVKKEVGQAFDELAKELDTDTRVNEDEDLL